MDTDSNVVRIVAQLDYDHNGDRESTKPVVFALHDALLALAEKYDGLSVVIIGYGDRDDTPQSRVTA